MLACVAAFPTSKARLFVRSAGALLLITASAKLISAAGSARILELPDPVLLISTRHLFISVGILELVIAILCLIGFRVLFLATLIAWLATNFVGYRFLQLVAGEFKQCSCLGNATDYINLSPNAAEHIVMLILGYLLLGSYIVVFNELNKRPSSGVSIKTSSLN